MKQLNEAVIKLINQDVIAGKKLIENELYQRLGTILEDKLVNYAPTIFEKKGKDLTGDGKVDTADWKAARNAAIKKKMQKESTEMISEEDGDEDDDDILSEEYENIVDDLQKLVESIEEENGEELTESEIQELAEMLLEEYESDNEEEDEEDEDEDEDFEEDSYEDDDE